VANSQERKRKKWGGGKSKKRRRNKEEGKALDFWKENFLGCDWEKNSKQILSFPVRAYRCLS
jgi:hypothetical protein